MGSLTNKINKENLKYVLLPGKNVPSSLVELYEQGYSFWKDIWSETFLELKGLKKLHSDEFMRQDEVTMLFNEQAPIGFFAYNWLNLDLMAHRDHSYLGTYPADILSDLRAAGHRQVMTMGNLAVHPAWRKNEAGIFVSEVLLGLGTKRFMASDATALIAYTRNNRKINDLVYRYGAVPLRTGLREHNVEVDIILIDKTTVKTSPFPEIPEYVDYLWETRLHGRGQ